MLAVMQHLSSGGSPIFFTRCALFSAKTQRKNLLPASVIDIISVTFTVVSTLPVMSFKIKTLLSAYVQKIPSFKDFIVELLEDLE